MPWIFFRRYKVLFVFIFFVLSLLVVESLFGEVSETRESLLFSVPPGIYNEDVKLSIESVSKGNVYYSFKLDSGFSPLVPYREPILLSAINGEDRRYTIRVVLENGKEVVEEKFVTYHIDKSSPKPPVFIVNGKETIYDSFVERNSTVISFRTEKGASVYYSIDDSVYGKSTLWDGKEININGVIGKRKEYRIEAFAIDRAGNKSPLSSLTFFIDRRSPKLEIISPVPGVYANYQLLVIYSRNLEWIKYSLDGSDPEKKGVIYDIPRLVKRVGHLTVSVVGKPFGSDKLLKKRVTIDVMPEKKASVYCDTESGVYSNGLKIAVSGLKGARIFYTLSENTPTEYDFKIEKYVNFPSFPGAEKFYVLRLRSRLSDGKWGGEYRYFYIIDRKKPLPPVIHIKRYIKNNRFTGKYWIVLESSSDRGFDKIFYSLTGRPDSSSIPYTKPFLLDPVNVSGLKQGKINIRAVAIDSANNKSDIALEVLSFDFTSPPKPKINFHVSKGEKSVCFEVDNSDKNKLSLKNTRVLYTISNSDTEPRYPDLFSPVLITKKKLIIPYGMEMFFKVRFAILTEGGIIYDLGDVKDITIDRMPPREPVVTVGGIPADKGKAGLYDKDIDVIVSGEGKIYYEVGLNGKFPDDPTFDSKRLDSKNGQASIKLRGYDGSIFRYIIKFLSVDTKGNISRVYGPYEFVIDKRIPTVPYVSNYKPNKRYGISPLVFYFPTDNTKLHYTFSSDGKEPADPDLDSPIIDRKLIFHGERERELDFWVKILPVSIHGNIRGEVKSLRFAIDLKPPIVPTLTGFKNGGVYRKPVYLKINNSELEKDSSVFVSFSTDSTPPPDPVKFGKKIDKWYLLDVPFGEESTFKVRVSTIDNAGNRALYDKFYSVTIDKKPPAAVTVSGIPASGVSNKTVVVKLSSYGSKIYYSMTDDGSVPIVPNEKSIEYNTPIMLSGVEGETVVYKIYPRTVDSAGNWDSSNRVYTVVIDREKPLAPSLPKVSCVYRNAQLGALLRWERGNDTIFYRLKVEEHSTAANYIEYRKPFFVNDGTIIEFFAQDSAGNRSKIRDYVVNLKSSRLSPPFFVGVKNDGSYNRDVVLDIKASEGEVHYELSLTGIEPPEVTPLSPVFKGPMHLNVMDGETVNVIVRAKAIDENNSLSSEARISFTLDKTPPQAPVIVGIENGMRYEDSKEFSLLSEEGTIYFSVSDNGRDPMIPSESEENRYKKSIVLTAREGEIVDYRIVAYTVDRAGNRSNNIPIWQVYIDKKIIYVSDRGNDLFNGTSSKPLKTIDRAMEVANKLKRKTIYIAYGKYEIHFPIEPSSGGLILRGGFDPNTWRQSRFYDTEIATGRYFKKGKSLISVKENGQLTVERIKLTDRRGIADYIIELGEGELNLVSCKIVGSNPLTDKMILQYGGKLTISDCTFSTEMSKLPSNVESVLSTGGNLYISGSIFERMKATEKITAIRAVENREIVLKGIKIEPMSAMYVNAISIENTVAKIYGCTLHSGVGQKSATALRVKKCNLIFENNSVESDKDSLYSASILVEESPFVRISNNTIDVNARYGASGIQISGGRDILLTRNRFIGGKAREYLYLLNISAPARVFNNLLLSGSSGDVVNIQVLDSSPKIFNNTIWGGEASDVAIGLLVRGNSTPRVINNIIANSLINSGTGILISTDKQSIDFPIIANNISGWGCMIEKEEISAKEGLYKFSNKVNKKCYKTEESVNTIDGNPFGGNIHKNIEEKAIHTFQSLRNGIFSLSKGSKCVNGGVNLQKYNGPNEDILGKKRPAPYIGIKPEYDIGAYELY